MEQSTREEVRQETTAKRIRKQLQLEGDLLRKRTKNYERVSQAGGSGATEGPPVSLNSQFLIQGHHIGSLKSAMVGVLAP